MSGVADASPPPTLTLLSRSGCHLCDDARDELALVLAERAAAGASVPRVVEVDIESDPALLARHLDSIPVLVSGAHELPLAMRPGVLRQFLTRILDGVPA
jgi:Glutaredoxin-like domain (DUF836)